MRLSDNYLEMSNSNFGGGLQDPLLLRYDPDDHIWGNVIDSKLSLKNKYINLIMA
jgi:hypothetical protein